MKRRNRIEMLIFSVSAIAYFPFSEWISTARIGTDYFLWGQIIYLLPQIAATIAAPCLIICLFFQLTRRTPLLYLTLAVIYIPCCVGGAILGNITRAGRMEAFAQRSQPLITAIYQYERDRCAPPKSLGDLVPDYLPGVPSTGMMAYPEYRYHTGVKAADEYADN